MTADAGQRTVRADRAPVKGNPKLALDRKELFAIGIADPHHRIEEFEAPIDEVQQRRDQPDRNFFVKRVVRLVFALAEGSPLLHLSNEATNSVMLADWRTGPVAYVRSREYTFLT